MTDNTGEAVTLSYTFAELAAGCENLCHCPSNGSCTEYDSNGWHSELHGKHCNMESNGSYIRREYRIHRYCDANGE